MHDKSKFSTVAVTIAIFLLVASSVCSAADFVREGKSEWFLLGGMMSGDKSSGSAMDIDVDINVGSSGFFGFGFGSNLSDIFNLNFDLCFGSTSLTSTATSTSPGALSGNITSTLKEPNVALVILDANVDYNFLKYRFTPMLTGGIGVIRFIGGLFDESDLSYNLGAGLRWDVSDKFAVKTIYRNRWTKLEDTKSSLSLGGAELSAGYKF